MLSWLIIVVVLIVLFLLTTGIVSVLIRRKPDCNDSFTYTNRVKKPFWKKLIPVWWLMNDDEQTVDQVDWYMPDAPHWKRWLYWQFRNPAQNLSAFVLGVQDKNYTVVGKYPVLTIQRDDLQPIEYGYHYTVIEKLFGLPFVSYCDQRKVWYIGWQPNGFFRVKYNRS